MIQHPFKFFAKILLGWRAQRRRQAEMIDVTTQFTQIKTGIILLPENTASLPVAIEKYKELQHIFNETTFEYLFLKNAPIELPGDIAERTKYIEKQDLTFLGTPSKSFMQAYAKQDFDLLIDLNDEFEIFATFFASESKAKLRVCLANPHRDAFYNFQVNAFNTKTLAEKYNILLKYLSKALTPAKRPASFQPA